MQKAHLNLIKYALEGGNSVSVWDGEEWQVKRSTQYKDIKDAIESVEEAQIRIRDEEGNVIGWALIIDAIDFEPEETVVDYTTTEYMKKWEEQYATN